MRELEQFASRCLKATSSQPNHTNLRAANGAGKDQMIIGPTVVWYMLKFPRAIVPLTSSSRDQLNTQTEPSCRRWANAWNLFAEQCQLPGRFIIRERKLVHTLTHASCTMFATDEEGKAEGFHPILAAGDQRMLIVINEAKNVSDKIYGALYRCRGYTDFLEISSPEQTSGEFYKNAQRSDVTVVRIPWTECPHITEEEYKVALEAHGGNAQDPWMLSSFEAEFADPSSDVAIPRLVVTECLRNPPAKKAEHIISAGTDMAVVNDETVVTIYVGNQWKASIRRRGFPSMTYLEDWLHEIYTEYKPTHIPIDYDGLGRGPVDNLVNRRGWTQIIPTQNGSTPARPHLYANRGTELYAEALRLITARVVTLDKSDEIMLQQLTTRRMLSGAKGKKILESKKQAKARRIPSPDRADSLVLALSVHNYESLVLGSKVIDDIPKEQLVPIRGPEDLRKYLRQMQQKQTGIQWKAMNF